MDGHLHRRERRGASSVGHAVGATKVKPIGDSSCNHVAQKAREAGFLPWLIMVANSLTNLLNVVFWHAVFTQRLHPDWALKARNHRGKEFLSRGHTQNARDPRAVHRCKLVAGSITKHLLCHDQREQLRGVGRWNDAWWDAPADRVKVDFA